MGIMNCHNNHEEVSLQNYDASQYMPRGLIDCWSSPRPGLEVSPPVTDTKEIGLPVTHASLQSKTADNPSPHDLSRGQKRKSWHIPFETLDTNAVTGKVRVAPVPLDYLFQQLDTNDTAGKAHTNL
jgi:hypothetical protein